jgi:1,4-dihydroxy-2-naphthoate octaprenyltransferase
LVVVVASVLAIQVGANIHKGLVESTALGEAPARPRSAFVFDAGAVRRLGFTDARLRPLMQGMYGAGALLGLVAVAMVREPALLLFGALGGFFAYSYSGKPLRLSFRGLGEIATFLAFGPIMLVGAAVAQYPPLLASFSPAEWSALLNPVPVLLGYGAAFGFLAALISFARYFPPLAEDAKKGKRTPVVILGQRRGAFLFLALALGAAGAFALTAQALVPFYACVGGVAAAERLGPLNLLSLSAALTALVGLFGLRVFPSGSPRRVEGAVAATVLLHIAVTAIALVQTGSLQLPEACLF